MKIGAYIALAIFAMGIAAVMFQFAACRNPVWAKYCLIEDSDC